MSIELQATANRLTVDMEATQQHVATLVENINGLRAELAGVKDELAKLRDQVIGPPSAPEAPADPAAALEGSDVAAEPTEPAQDGAAPKKRK